MKKIIKCSDYRGMCQFYYNGELPKQNAVVFCPGSQLIKLFESAKNSKHSFVVVHAEDDFSISDNSGNFLQNIIYRGSIVFFKDKIYETNIVPDVSKVMVQLSDWVNHEEVIPTKKYVIHTDQWIQGTFDGEDIPENIIKIFTVHLNINHPKFELIPYGASNDGLSKFLLNRENAIDKKDDVYCKWSDNAAARILLRLLFRQGNNGIFCLDENRYDDVGEVYRKMMGHKFVLCPFGNGFDNYRTVETVALNLVPIMQKSIFSVKMRELFPSVAFVNNIMNFNLDQIEEGDSKRESEAVYYDYWEDKIQHSFQGNR